MSPNDAKPGLNVAVLPVTPLQQNCSLVWDGTSKSGAVVDPGGDVEQILAAIDQVGMVPEKIVLTHGHIDHAGGAAELREKLRAKDGVADDLPIEGPDRRDEFLLQGIAEQGRMWGLEGARDVEPDRWLEEGQTLHIAGQAFEIFHCPGHSPGSLVYFNRAMRFALVGDVLFQGSIGRTDFPYGDHEALIRAIEEKLLPLGDDVAFLCGHGPGSTIGRERVGNPFLAGA